VLAEKVSSAILTEFVGVGIGRGRVFKIYDIFLHGFDNILIL